MDIGGVKLAPAAASANIGTANRVEPTASGARAVETQLVRDKAVAAIGDTVPGGLDQRQQKVREQLSREAALRNFIQTRNVVDPRSRELVMRSVDTRTGQVVRQFPDEIALKLREYLNQMRDMEDRQSGADQRVTRNA